MRKGLSVGSQPLKDGESRPGRTGVETKGRKRRDDMENPKNSGKGGRVSGGNEESSIPWAWTMGNWKSKLVGRNTKVDLGP